MSLFRSLNCHKHGHPEFSIFVNDEAGLDASWLLSYFESEVQGGKCFNPEETVQIGWMVVILKSGSSGDLEVWEPEFDSVPIRWTKGVNNTLRHLILQKSMADVFGTEPDFPSLRQAGMMTEAFTNSEGFSMVRRESEGNISGWEFSTFDGSGDPFELRSLFEVSFYHPDVIPFLALPPGAIVHKNTDSIKVVVGDQTATSATNIFLDGLTKMTVFV